MRYRVTCSFGASWGRAVDIAPVGSRWSAEGKDLGTLVFQTGRPARMDSYADASGPLGATAREKDTRSSVATPVIVEGRLWGVMIAGAAGEQPLPAETEARLTSCAASRPTRRKPSWRPGARQASAFP